MIVEKCKVEIKCDANGCANVADVSVSFDGVAPQYHFCNRHAKTLGDGLIKWCERVDLLKDNRKKTGVKGNEKG